MYIPQMELLLSTLASRQISPPQRYNHHEFIRSFLGLKKSTLTYIDPFLRFIVPPFIVCILLYVTSIMHRPYHWLRLIWRTSVFSSVCDRVVINHPEFFPKPGEPISADGDCLHLLRPKLYSVSAFHSFKQTNLIHLHLRNFSRSTLVRFKSLLQTNTLVSLLNPC